MATMMAETTPPTGGWSPETQPSRPPLGRRLAVMKADQIKERLHQATHRGHTKATEEELEAVTAVVLAILAEVTTELAAVIGELSARIEALEAAVGT